MKPAARSVLIASLPALAGCKLDEDYRWKGMLYESGSGIEFDASGNVR